MNNNFEELAVKAIFDKLTQDEKKSVYNLIIDLYGDKVTANELNKYCHLT